MTTVFMVERVDWEPYPEYVASTLASAINYIGTLEHGWYRVMEWRVDRQKTDASSFCQTYEAKTCRVVDATEWHGHDSEDRADDEREGR